MAGVEEKRDDGLQKQEKNYIYLLVMFNKRGPQTGKQDFDFVPASWVSVSKKTGKLVVKFMPPPYLKKTCQLLNHLIKSLSDPIADWPEYNVQIKGGAESYKEAGIRVAELDAKRKKYAFTTDADEMPEQKASKIIRQLKQTKLKMSAEAEAALQVTGLSSDHEEASSSNELFDSVPRQLSKPSSSQSTLIDGEDILTVSKCHDQPGNPKVRDLKKKQTNTTSGLKALDHNANLRLTHFKQTKTIVKAPHHLGNPKIPNFKQKRPDLNEKLTVINTDTQASTSESYPVDSVDENLNMSDGSLPENVCQFERNRDKLTVDNVYTSSEDEGHIDVNRNVEAARDSSLQMSTRYDFHETYGNYSVENHKKPSKPNSEKSEKRKSKSCNDKRSKSSRSKDQSHSRQGDPISNPTKTNSKSNSKNLNKKCNTSRKLKSKDDFTSDSELLWDIYEDLQHIKVTVDEIRANQRKEEELRQKYKVEDGIRENFIVKYNLDLPYATKEAFDKFNANLLSDKDFRIEFMKSLVKFFDKDFIASRTMCNILRKYLTRKLALKFTAIKKMPEKFFMKDTAFFDCLLGVLADTHRDKCSKFLSESTFSSILGTVLGNAKDWDGKKNRKDLESDSDGVSCDQASSVDG